MWTEKSQVALESAKEKCSVKRFLLVVIAIFVVACLILACLLIWKTIELEQEINSLKKENECYKGQMSDMKVEIVKKINETEISLRRLIDNRTPFIVAAVDDLRQELNSLRNSTTANVSELWKHWNRTDAEIEDIIKLMARQNETLHFKIAYHSDVLYAEVKVVEKKQLKFHNDTKINLEELRSELKQTRHSLQENFDNQIARANKTWRKALEDIDGYLRLSTKKINVKVDAIKKELQKSINNYINKQQEMKDDFLKTKASFQEKDRKHDLAISGQVTKMESMQKRIAKVEGKLNSKTKKMETE